VKVLRDVGEKDTAMTVWAKELYVTLAHQYPDALEEIEE
jgi:hypothetical protein